MVLEGDCCERGPPSDPDGLNGTVCAASANCVLWLMPWQVFYVCRHPTATMLISPANGAIDVFNIGMMLQWTPYTAAMIGTPCSAIFIVPLIYVLLDRRQDLNVMDLNAHTIFANTTTTTSQTTSFGGFSASRFLMPNILLSIALYSIFV